MRSQFAEFVFCPGSLESWFFLPFPRYIDVGIAGPEEAKNLAGRKALGLIQIRLTTASFDKNRVNCQHNSPQGADHGFEFGRRRQLFIGAHNETLSVVAMCVLPNGHLIVEGCRCLALSGHQISPVITGVVSADRETRNRDIFGSDPRDT